ncbi:MAG TPA: PP2C family serine/threonine-protein phosphatase [Polyangia bacterium]|nr:PP2C family serine/threonine-protein phosphatase [Polyangia bacterium]
MRWRVLGRSVRGAAHVRSGAPNQDAIDWLTTGEGPPLVVAIADGHGSAKSFRSERGARLAVDAVLAECAALTHAPPAEALPSAIKRMAEEHLPRLLVRRWTTAVDEALAAEPFTPAELEALERKEGASARAQIEKDPRLAYGATVLATVVAPHFLFHLQLGDGDILCVSERGEVTRPIGRDPRHLGNQTTSLCSPAAEREVRIAFQTRSSPTPALILLATDGYANSFRDDAAFLQVGPDLLALLREEGVDSVEQALEGWLTDASASGSGDDITLGLLCRLDGLAAGPGAPA